MLALLILGVLVFSGFFSGAEAVLLSITEAEVEAYVHEKKKGSHVLKKINDSLDRSIFAIVIMNNVVNIVGSVLVGNITMQLYGSASLAIVTTCLTLGVIVFSEILPKSLGMHYAHQAAIPIAIIIRSLICVLYPFILVLELLTDLFKRGERRIGTEQQIRSLVTIGRRAGYIENDEGQLIHRAFILNDKTAKDIMTPLKDIIGVEENETIGEVAAKVFRENHSRYPVFGDSIHELKGVVISHDILRELSEGHEGQPMESILQPGLTIPYSIRSDALLALFRDERKHLALVQEKGKTIGLVTLEDVLEELVGEIEDELDARDGGA